MVHDLSDRSVVVFDDERAVANAGVMLPALLAGRLGIEQLVDDAVDLGDRAGAANPGRKVMSLVSAMALGADCIEDCDVLRSGQTGAVLGHVVAAPSTLGTFLRAFTFGHVRQLDRVLDQVIARAWAAGAGPGDGRLVIDADSFVGEVHGYAKQGVGFGYTHKRGYHPILATRADTGEVLHIRLRHGSANTSRGMLRFCEEVIARVNRAGAMGEKLLRADSGFWNKKTFARLDTAGWKFSIGVRMQPHVRVAVEAINENAWVTLEDYPETSIAQIAETTLGDWRLVVRRVRRLSQQGELLPVLGALPLRDQPHGYAHRGRGRAPPARCRRARDPRSQRPSHGALPLRQVQRQRRVDRDRRTGTQPAALDTGNRPAQRDHQNSTHTTPPTARAARSTRALRAAHNTTDARLLALGR